MDPLTLSPIFQLKCSSCGEVGEKFTRIELSEKTALPGSRGEANLVIKCKLCSRVNSADIIADSVKPYTADDNESYKTVLVLDCRGVEPVDFFAGQGYKCKGEETGTVFDKINLEEGEWVDYDEKAASSVGIYTVEHRFVKV